MKPKIVLVVLFGAFLFAVLLSSFDFFKIGWTHIDFLQSAIVSLLTACMVLIILKINQAYERRKE